MIRSFRHKGLRDFYFDGTLKGIDANSAKRLRRMLDILAAAASPFELSLPGYGFHVLSGDKAGYFAVKVTGNWRLVFAFEDEDAVDLELMDYH